MTEGIERELDLNLIDILIDQFEERGEFKKHERLKKIMYLAKDGLKLPLQIAQTKQLETQLSEANAEIERLKETLEFYADSYTYGDGNGLSWESTRIVGDRGWYARNILKKEQK